ncbi:uncharacterized protein DSM5745_05979 [Aspergillus mulundensis]|uniref:AttH domain-containing protein n=1 Tax=Aspergillus mulundensis TaxID=1810919 RepID=A0A3D8RYJ1_9EURO|nr:Uncharacterized protein DSM5745_05979 [Aspergillus mulundensis]RDW79127.1 Uncharacterized protein DSM5745_05979 [Aspergillus mulundensis]
MFSKLNVALWAIPALNYFSQCSGYLFAPDDDQVITDPRLPVLFDIPAPQTLLPTPESPVAGYWTSSFLTTTTGSQYFLATGVVVSTQDQLAGYGFSLLDLATLNRVSHSSITTSFANSDIIGLSFAGPRYKISDLSTNGLGMTVQGDAENASVNLTIHPTSRALYYGGSGAWMYVDKPMYGWALPAAQTSGNITLPFPVENASAPTNETTGDAAVAIIDPSASLTWYDHLWGHMGLQEGNITWFNLFVDDKAERDGDHDDKELNLALVSYLLDSVNPPFFSRSIHVRQRDRNESALAIIPVDRFEPSSDPSAIWTSPLTGLSYPQRWDLGIEGRGLLTISSVLGDQELVDPGSGGTTYVGFVTVEGQFDGKQVSGYGSVEVKFVQRLP